MRNRTGDPVRSGMHIILARRLTILIVVGTLLGLTACQSRRLQAVDNTITPGDRLYGRIAETSPTQEFQFEAVEYGVLRCALETDCRVENPPQIMVFDPDGVQVPTDGRTKIEREDKSTRVVIRDVILRKTGTYGVSVRPSHAPEPVYFTFSHVVNYPGPIPTPISLVDDKLTHVTVAAPRGARVRVRVAADKGSRVRPQIHGVRDPEGGRALDRGRLVRGMRAPTMEEGDDEVILEFTAPATGRYTILNAACPGTCGRATAMTTVTPPCGRRRDVRLVGCAPGVSQGPRAVAAPVARAPQAPLLEERPLPAVPPTEVPTAVAPRKPVAVGAPIPRAIPAPLPAVEPTPPAPATLTALPPPVVRPHGVTPPVPLPATPDPLRAEPISVPRPTVVDTTFDPILPAPAIPVESTRPVAPGGPGSFGPPLLAPGEEPRPLGPLPR